MIVNTRHVTALIKKDPLFAKIKADWGLPPNWQRPQGFVTLCKLILEQQVSLASAHAHFTKLNGYVKAFEPKYLAKLSDEEYRSCHISRQKSTYLRALSEALLNGQLDIEALEQAEETEVRSQLTAIKGIGQWTTDVYLMFCLQRTDIFPIGDIAVVNTIKEFTGLQTREEMLAHAENWRPYRSLAVYFLWHHYLKKRNRTPLI